MPTIHRTAFIASTAAVMGDVTLGEESSVWYGAVLAGTWRRSSSGRRPTSRMGVWFMWTQVSRASWAAGWCRPPGHPARLHRRGRLLDRMGSILLNGVSVGAGSVVAAGAVVPEGMQVPPGSLVMGVPARIVRPVDAALAERAADTWRHYVKEARSHRAGHYPLCRISDLTHRQSTTYPHISTSPHRHP